MSRAGIALVAVAMFVGGDLSAQQATPLALKLSISDDLCLRYGGLDPQECGQFEKSVSEKIARTIADRYWYRFCWQLRAADKNDPAPDGEVRIELDRNNRRDNWIMVVRITRTNSPRFQHTFDPIEVLESGELLRNRGPTKDKLPDRLGEWLRQHYFCNDRVAQIHNKLKAIPVGEGVPSINQDAAAPKPFGAVLIPWNDYNQFKSSKFRFEGMGQSWLTTANGDSVVLENKEVIKVVPDQALPGQVSPRSAVYLVEFVEGSGAGTASGTSELLSTQ